MSSTCPSETKDSKSAIFSNYDYSKNFVYILSGKNIFLAWYQNILYSVRLYEWDETRFIDLKDLIYLFRKQFVMGSFPPLDGFPYNPCYFENVCLRIWLMAWMEDKNYLKGILDVYKFEDLAGMKIRNFRDRNPPRAFIHKITWPW